jgi:hypothetical protein
MIPIETEVTTTLGINVPVKVLVPIKARVPIKQKVHVRDRIKLGVTHVRVPLPYSCKLNFGSLVV